jgi:hypothetical protein
MQTKTLQTKQGTEWTNDAGQTFPAQTLYRFVDENGKGGCWYGTLERAEMSWTRWLQSAPRREQRKGEAARYREQLEALEACERSADPFAGL